MVGKQEMLRNLLNSREMLGIYQIMWQKINLGENLECSCENPSNGNSLHYCCDGFWTERLYTSKVVHEVNNVLLKFSL